MPDIGYRVRITGTLNALVKAKSGFIQSVKGTPSKQTVEYMSLSAFFSWGDHVGH